MQKRRLLRRIFSPLLIALLLLTMVVGFGSSASASGNGNAQTAVTGELLVKFAPTATNGDVASALQSENGAVAGALDAIGVRRVKLAGTAVATAIQHLKANKQVQYAEPNYIAHATITPNDPSFAQQWGLSKIQAPQGWDLFPKTFTTPPLGVTIAIVDTGVDLNHPDLINQLVPGTTFVAGTTTPQDDNGHGTHCAGIAAAETNNGIGVAGVAFNSKVMPVKVLDSTGSGSYADVSSGIIWAADHGAKVISMSLGGSAFSQALQDAVTYAYNKGALVVVAAGNTGTNVPQYPAAMTNAMAIGASDSTDTIATFSSFGSWVSVAAPGVDIYSTYWSAGSTYASLSGTSMATPHVAGLAALLFSQDTTRTNAQVRSLIENSADKVGGIAYTGGRNDYFGYGRINVYVALGGTATPPPPPPAPASPCTTNCN